MPGAFTRGRREAQEDRGEYQEDDTNARRVPHEIDYRDDEEQHAGNGVTQSLPRHLATLCAGLQAPPIARRLIRQFQRSVAGDVLAQRPVEAWCRPVGRDPASGLFDRSRASSRSKDAPYVERARGDRSFGPLRRSSAASSVGGVFASTQLRLHAGLRVTEPPGVKEEVAAHLLRRPAVHLRGRRARRPKLLYELGVGAPNNEAQHRRDQQGVVEVADDRDEVGHQVDG